MEYGGDGLLNYFLVILFHLDPPQTHIFFKPFPLSILHHQVLCLHHLCDVLHNADAAHLVHDHLLGHQVIMMLLLTMTI